MRFYLISPLLLLLFITLKGQTTIDSVYKIEKIERSTRFAATTFGLDLLSVAGGSMMINSQNTNLPNNFIPRLTIGGIHFWGHADFYVSFPIGVNITNKPANTNMYSLRESIESGAKFYPLAMKSGKIRPYIGVSFQPFIFRYASAGTNFRNGAPTFQRMNTPLHLGISYTTKNTIISFGTRYLNNPSFSYHILPTETTNVNLRAWSFNFSFLKYFDTSKSLATPNSVDQLNIKLYLLNKENRLSSWYWGVGPSTALQISRSPYFRNNLPYINKDKVNTAILPEVSVGRYFGSLDANLNLAFRTMSWSLKGFDTKINMSRSSFAMEPTKFLFDYHGFAPYIGPSIGIDKLSYNENNSKTSQIKPAIGIVFGWDIRLSKTETSLLRTNLRYMPNHNLKVNGEKVMYDHLEFNFIQYIRYFGRAKFYKKYRKQS